MSFYPQVAWADPHAVFYTAIGQQQLFYNVLAALDQADYVETQYAREQLLEKRAKEDVEPPFRDEEFPLTEATKVGQDVTSETDPGIADILTRLITLEGTDFYNDQLVREFGAEHGRRNATSELLRALCDYGLGIEDCDNDIQGKTPQEIDAMEDHRRSAMVRDPLAWNLLPFTEGVGGALSSGLAEDELLRQSRMFDSETKTKIPRAFSPEIARWRWWIENYSGDDKVLHERILNHTLATVTASFLHSELPDFPYEKISVTSEGMPTVATSTYKEVYVPGQGNVLQQVPMSAHDYTEAANEVLLGPLQVERIAYEAAQRIAMQQGVVEDEGLLADVGLISQAVMVDASAPYGGPLTPENELLSTFGELRYVVENPVAVRKADVYSLPIALALLDTSQQASSLAGIDQPGSVQLVERGGSETSGPTCNCVSPGDPNYDPSLPLCPAGDPQCQVQGLRSLDGQVLGTLDLFNPGEYPRYDKLKDPTSPSGNIIAGHLEQGAVHALRVLTGGEFRKSFDPNCQGGFTCP